MEAAGPRSAPRPPSPMRLAAASLLLSAAAAWPDCAAYYGNATSAPARWCREGGYFMFRSPTGNNNGSAIPLFYHCSGDPASARVPVLFAHGYPTSSFDLAGAVAALARELDARELSVCAVDMAGFGFSAKPRADSLPAWARAWLGARGGARPQATRDKLKSTDRSHQPPTRVLDLGVQYSTVRLLYEVQQLW